MSDERDNPTEPEEPEKTNLPAKGSRFEARSYALSVRFHPEIKLDRKRGHQFAASLADYLNLEKNEFESHKWTFYEPLPGEESSGFLIAVAPNFIELNIRLPKQIQELAETRFATVLRKFQDIFKPQFLLQSEATVRGTLPIDGDARAFLAIHVMRMNPNRVDSFGRPLHLLGLKFFFPPYIKKKSEEDNPQVTDWHVSVRAESLMEDPSKLFLEAEATWVEAHPWERDDVTALSDHLETVKNYLEKNVMQFLQASLGDGDRGENGDFSEEGE
jgi:hypothetical protein